MNNKLTLKKPIPKDWHPADIKAALEKKGWSLRQLALHHGYCGHYFCQVMRKKHFNAQQIIADTLGLEPRIIWPSRYDEEGRPLRSNSWLPLKRPAHWGRSPKTRRG